ncbi:variable large family protein [Borrelia coriaceae]|uniref:Variable large protein n=1 Tax=Borrelia coriaceae ATCC 43381 TaxID=1408429 RepID=W5T399_9SPIR|nr:variable large family protein [Borrelia coriaceae]AHH11796.1 Variable outer membrane protein [Borrelia coriaceae ATCC 43381]
MKKLKRICATLFISLFLACNNGVIEELEKRNHFLSSLANLGNDFLNIFTSFGDSLAGVLGFDTNTKKSEVGDYFKNIQKTVEGVKSKLNKIIENMKREENPNTAATETAVTTLNEKLMKIISGAKKVSGAIGEGVNDEVGKVVKGADGSKPTGVDDIIDGIKEILNIVLQQEGSAAAGTNKVAKDGTERQQNAGVALLFVKKDNSSAKESAGDASKAVGAVTGADVLKGMIDPKAKSIAENVDTTNAKDVANAQDALIAGALALKGMAKDGKFATANDGTEAKDEIKNAVASAVTKALSTLTVAIRKTIEDGLKKVKEAMKISPDSLVTTEASIANK